MGADQYEQSIPGYFFLFNNRRLCIEHFRANAAHPTLHYVTAFIYIYLCDHIFIFTPKYVSWPHALTKHPLCAYFSHFAKMLIHVSMFNHIKKPPEFTISGGFSYH